MTTIVDASVVVSAVIDEGDAGEWSRAVLTRGALVAPQVMPSEVTGVLRRHVLAGHLHDAIGSLALDEVTQMTIDLLPFVPFTSRVWHLRQSVTVNDAWYVAVAETLRAPLATLDRRLARANGPTCEFLTP